MYLKSPALGKEHIHDSSHLTTDNYKALPGRLHGESCLPHKRFGAQPVHDGFLERAAVRDSGSPGLEMWKSFSCIQLLAPLSMGFSRQEYWSGVPFPSPGIFPTQGSNWFSHIAGSFFAVWATREAGPATLTYISAFLTQAPPFRGFLIIASAKVNTLSSVYCLSRPSYLLVPWLRHFSPLWLITFYSWPFHFSFPPTPLGWKKYRSILGESKDLDSILKSRDITLPTKVHIVKAMVFPVVRYRCESWTIKKAKHRRIDAFELWCWRRLLRVPWTARRSNQSILKEIGPGCSWKDWCWSWNSNMAFGHLMWRVDSLGKTDAGRDWEQEEKRTTEDEMAGWHHWLDGHEFEWTPGVGDGQGGLACCDSWDHRVGHDWATELSWTELTF